MISSLMRPSADIPGSKWTTLPDREKRLIVKNFDSRTHSISDLLDWDKQKALELNPKFQRRAVWTDKAKSYLMDTIIRGKPMPKIFIRQEINTTTKTSTRDVVDGQQRVRTILSYVKDGFSISRSHNREFGGKRFSQLPQDVQVQLLSYEVAIDFLINLPDSEVLDIFSRLNSYAIVLNEQETLNANHFGPFKVLADKIAGMYYEYWLKQNIISSRHILRMAEVNLVDLLIAMREGIKSKKQVKRFCTLYENLPEESFDGMDDRFDGVINTIALLYPEGISDTEFNRPVLFYSLFTAITHVTEGLRGLDVARPTLVTTVDYEIARNRLDRVNEIFEAKAIANLPNRKEQEFLQDCQRATTDEAVRIRRTMFLLDLMRF